MSLTATQRREALATYIAKQLRALNRPNDADKALALADSVLAAVSVGRLFILGGAELNTAEAETALIAALAAEATKKPDAPEPAEPAPRTAETTHGEIKSLITAWLERLRPADCGRRRDCVALVLPRRPQRMGKLERPA